MDFFLNEDRYSHSNYRQDLLDPNTQLGNYWIGFFLADGHLTDKGALEFFQCIKNQPIVDKFNNYAKGNIKATFPSMNREGNKVYIQKSSVVDQYKNYLGISTNMKINPIFNKILNHIDKIKGDSRLLNAFIAGFIDGDGHIRKDGSCRIELKSTWEPFLKKIKEVLGLNSNVCKRKNRDASYLNIKKTKMRDLKRGQEIFIGPRWERITESFDFNNNDFLDICQNIEDQKVLQKIREICKNIQADQSLQAYLVYNIVFLIVKGLSSNIGVSCKSLGYNSSQDSIVTLKNRNNFKSTSIIFHNSHIKLSEFPEKYGLLLINALKEIEAPLDVLNEAFSFDDYDPEKEIENNISLLSLIQKPIKETWDSFNKEIKEVLYSKRNTLPLLVHFLSEFFNEYNTDSPDSPWCYITAKWDRVSNNKMVIVFSSYSLAESPKYKEYDPKIYNKEEFTKVIKDTVDFLYENFKSFKKYIDDLSSQH